MLHNVWAEINLNSIEHNLKALKSITNPDSKFMAVVKADGYGHGAYEIAKKSIESGADYLSVARIDEAVYLRNKGIVSPLLILGYTALDSLNKVVNHNLVQTLYSFESAKRLSEIAVSKGKTAKIHIKIDTGMGRLGFLPDPMNTNLEKGFALKETERIVKLPNIELEGVFTHFACADSRDKTFTNNQFEIFLSFLHELKKGGIEPEIRHAANSAGIIDLPETHLDMVRAGISLYGLYPSQEVNKANVKLIPAMELKSKVVNLKSVKKDFTVSYGATYITDKDTTIASIPVGYADGLNRLLSSKGEMILKGKRFPIAGRVCMDQTMLDIGDFKAEIEDEVVVFGKQQNEELSIDELADSLNTINYEIVTTITKRVPRIYIR